MSQRLYDFDREATAEFARATIMADDLLTFSRVECPACGMTARARHTVGARLSCPKCGAETWRFTIPGQDD